MLNEFSQSTGQQSAGGMMSELGHSQTPNGLTLFVEGSPAKTLATQAKAQDLAESEADCSTNSCELLATWNQDLLCWRTSQRCLIEGWETYLERWPRSGSMQSGTAYQRRPLADTTIAIVCSFWPTARAQARGCSRNRVQAGEHNFNLEDWLHILLVRAGWNATTVLNVNPDWLEWWMGFSQDWTKVEVEDLGIQSSPKSQNGSADES